jgi:hypothetical protein
VTERNPFPPPPIKSRVEQPDGLLGSQWRQWVGALTLWVQRVRVFSFAVDVPSLGAGASWWVQVSCPGVVAGDFAAAALAPADRDLTVTAQVTAADVVTVWVVNLGAGAVDLAPGVLRVRVEKSA